MKKRFRTLDISEHELAADFLVQRSDLNSVRLKPLCPENVFYRWRTNCLWFDFSLFFMTSVFMGYVTLADYFFEKPDLRPMYPSTLIAPILVLGFSVQTAKYYLNQRRFRNQNLVFGNGANRWISEYEKCSPTFRILAIFLYPLLLIGWFVILINSWNRPFDLIDYCFYLLFFFVMGFHAFRSDQTALGKPGLFDRGSFVPWSRILEYRWFEDRSALLLIVDRWSTKSPMVIFPVQEELQEQVEQLLREYAPDKQREDVEPALEKLDSQDSATAATSSA